MGVYADTPSGSFLFQLTLFADLNEAALIRVARRHAIFTIHWDLGWFIRLRVGQWPLVKVTSENPGHSVLCSRFDRCEVAFGIELERNHVRSMLSMTPPSIRGAVALWVIERLRKL